MRNYRRRLKRHRLTVARSGPPLIHDSIFDGPNVVDLAAHRITGPALRNAGGVKSFLPPPARGGPVAIKSQLSNVNAVERYAICW
jgi:hypothetical protein